MRHAFAAIIVVARCNPLWLFAALGESENKTVLRILLRRIADLSVRLNAILGGAVLVVVVQRVFPSQTEAPDFPGIGVFHGFLASPLRFIGGFLSGILDDLVGSRVGHDEGFNDG